MTTVRGVDVSENNGRQEWGALAAAGVHFAFIKASEGNHTRDHRFSVHMTDAKAAKITVRGGYHFAWPNESAATNAANYISVVRPYAGPGFVHVLDLEEYEDGRNWHGTTAAGRVQWVRDWLVAVHRAFPGAALMVYAGSAYDDLVPLVLNVDGHTVTVARWYPAYPWHSSTWALAESHARPRTRGGHAVDFWQFGSDGGLDRSLFFGSLADLVKWAGGGDAVPAPAPKPKPPTGHPRQVTVRAGMTLSAIALMLGSTVTALAHYNHISNPNRIYPGQVISAPPVAPAKPKPKPTKTAPAYTVHVVRKGETLSGIAAAAGIRDWRTLAAYNHLSHPDRLTVGQQVRIPKGTTK